MREPAFWRRREALAGRLLTPLAAVYGAVAARRLAQPGEAAGVPVLCVGNPTLGGAGKTPTAIAIARLLLEAGRRPFLLSRGYGGRLGGPVRVDPAVHTAADTGDEPLLLAQAAPTIVARDRVAGARAAAGAGADVIVMDDGFQNPSLKKDRSLLVIDGTGGIGNGRVFPAGPLRAPLPAQLARADALLVVGDPSNVAFVSEAASGLPVFHGRLEPDAQAVAALRPHGVLAFAGIASPDKFFATLAAAGIEVRARRAFPDHHPFTPDEAAGLLAAAEREGLVLVTTEKDRVRLKGTALAERAMALPVRLVVGEADEFRRWVLTVVG